MSSRLAGILLVRFLVLWFAVRAVVGAVGLLAHLTMPPSSGTSMRIAAVLAALAYVDLRRRGERILLGNLGVAVPTVITAAFVVALGAEAALGIAWGAVAG